MATPAAPRVKETNARGPSESPSMSPPTSETSSKTRRISGETSCSFFQAEGGMRDTSVTGVQRCALPICLRYEPQSRAELFVTSLLIVDGQPREQRSEERRVGKEWRSRWAPYH